MCLELGNILFLYFRNIFYNLLPDSILSNRRICVLMSDRSSDLVTPSGEKMEKNI